jgi:hypothetical protein
MKTQRIVGILAVVAAFLVVLATTQDLELIAQTGPSITAVSGALAHGNSVAITGVRFGAKTTAAPLKFDDFQSVNIGSQIVTSTAPGPAWTNNGGVLPPENFFPIATAMRVRPGTPYTRNMQSHWNSAGGPSKDVSNIALVNQVFQKFYVDAWMYNDLSGVTSGFPQNVKHIRMHQNNAGCPNVGVTNVPNGPAYAAARDCTADGGVNPGFNVITGSTFYGQWVHVQWMVDAGSGGTATNGKVRSYINGVLRYDRSDLGLLNTGFTGWTGLFLGNYYRNDNEYTGDIYAFWDSVYVDTSWAHVEIGNNATYANCTQREIQIPSAWSDTSMTVKLNRGSFPTLSTLYLFVIDSSGVVSPGFPLSSTTGTPTAPRNLRVVPG